MFSVFLGFYVLSREKLSFRQEHGHKMSYKPSYTVQLLYIIFLILERECVVCSVYSSVVS